VKTNRLISASTLFLLLAGCSISQTVKPVEQLASRQVCIVENPAVTQQGFLATYRRVLIEKGYTVQLLPPSASITACPITSTYTANWRWDLALYLAYADIKVFNNGQQAGQATYDSMSGAANMGKFIRGDAKIGELVNALFPGGAR